MQQNLYVLRLFQSHFLMQMHLFRGFVTFGPFDWRSGRSFLCNSKEPQTSQTCSSLIHGYLNEYNVVNKNNNNSGQHQGQIYQIPALHQRTFNFVESEHAMIKYILLRCKVFQLFYSAVHCHSMTGPGPKNGQTKNIGFASGLKNFKETVFIDSMLPGTDQ